MIANLAIYTGKKVMLGAVVTSAILTGFETLEALCLKSTKRLKAWSDALEEQKYQYDKSDIQHLCPTWREGAPDKRLKYTWEDRRRLNACRVVAKVAIFASETAHKVVKGVTKLLKSIFS